MNNNLLSNGQTLSAFEGNVAKASLTNLFKILRKIKLGDETSLLQSGVEVIHQALSCDRVVVYSLQSDAYSQITAEAVTPGFAETLGTTIQDPCFEAGYIDKYRKGRVRAITDIYQSGMSACHIESLAKIDVRSNLVVPLVHSDHNLYGLLVMHQCSKTREWQQSEVELVLQVASWLMEQLSSYIAVGELKSQVKNLTTDRELLNEAIGKIHGASSGAAVMQQGAVQAQQILQCDRIVVYGLQEQNIGEILAEAQVSALAPILGSVIKDPCFEYRYLEQYQRGRVRGISNIFEAGMSDCYVDNLAKIGVKSNLVVPINWDDGSLFGLLVAHQCFDFKEWQSAEIANFRELAFQMGLALSKTRIQAQSQTIETGLERLHQVQEKIGLAQSRLELLKQPIHNSHKILVEVHNLNKLLERECQQISLNGSPQAKKDTKLVQIIARKLISITSKLNNALENLKNGGQQANLILDEAIAQIEGKQVDRDDG